MSLAPTPKSPDNSALKEQQALARQRQAEADDQTRIEKEQLLAESRAVRSGVTGRIGLFGDRPDGETETGVPDKTTLGV